MNVEPPRARIFIICGQSKNSDEVQVAREIGNSLGRLGFDTYIAVDVQDTRAVAVAVRRRIHHRGGGDIAGRSRAVLDHEALPKPLRQPLSDQPAEDVVAAARRITDDDANLPRGIVLRPCKL
jgi:hypothetical protein